MAEAALIAKLEVRLNTLEKQLKKAGAMAQDAVDDINGKFAKANPTLGRIAGGAFLGNMFSEAARQGVQLMDDLTRRFRDLETTARVTGLTIQEMFRAQSALGFTQGINQAITSIATLLDRAGRGEDNALSKILKVNDQDIRSVKDATEAWSRIVDIIFRAKNDIQAREIGKSLGIPDDVVDKIRQADVNLANMLKTAADGEQDLAKLAAAAKEFDDLWQAAIQNLKAAFLGVLPDLTAAMRAFIEGTARELRGLSQIGNSIGDMLGLKRGTDRFVQGAEALEGAAKGLQQGSGPLVVDLNKNRGTASRPLPLGGGGGGGGSDRLNAFEREERRARERIAQMELEARTLGMSTEARARATEALRLEQMAEREGIPITDALRASIEAQAAGYGKAAMGLDQARERMRELQSASRELSAAISDGFSQMIFEGAKFNDVLNNMAKQLGSRAISRLFDSILVGPASGGAGGIFGTLFGGLPKFQQGGIVPGSGPMPAIVHGGEVVLPKAAVRALGKSGGGGITIVQHISANGDQSIRQIAAQGITQALSSYDRRLPQRLGDIQVRFT